MNLKMKQKNNAQMAKLVDALGLGSNEVVHAGSSPVLRRFFLFVQYLSLILFLT